MNSMFRAIIVFCTVIIGVILTFAFIFAAQPAIPVEVSKIVYHQSPNYEYESLTSEGEKVKIVTIDGCEYIKNNTHGWKKVYTHKGNCKNPIHITGVAK